MTWARLDDGFYSHPKTIKAWTEDRASIGLHVQALTWVAAHDQDGRIPAAVTTMLLPDQAEREAAIAALLEAGIWHEIEDGAAYLIHDYLDYNPSRAELAAKREADRVRKASARKPSGR